MQAIQKKQPETGIHSTYQNTFFKTYKMADRNNLHLFLLANAVQITISSASNFSILIQKPHKKYYKCHYFVFHVFKVSIFMGFFFG